MFLNISKTTLRQPPTIVAYKGCTGNSLYKDSLTSYDPVTGLMRFFYRITITYPKCWQWSSSPNPPHEPDYYHNCDDATTPLYTWDKGICPPFADINYVENLEHYVIRYWGPGQIDPYIFTTTLEPSVVVDPGIGTVIVILIPG